MARRDCAWFAVGVLVTSLLACYSAAASRSVASTGPSDNPALARLFAEDQGDRRPLAGATIDWPAVTRRDRAREEQVKMLFSAGDIRSANDHYHAAMVLQHSQTPNDHLLAHELAVIAAARGNKRALWLAAAAEDRFLMNIRRPQRFGTQFAADPGEGPNAPMRLYVIDAVVTDQLRQEFGVPTLAEAKAREQRLNKPRG